MSKIPRNPQDIFPEITEDFKHVFGEDLVSVILYGSGARGDYVPGKSDINLLIILSRPFVDVLDRTVDAVGKWKKRNVAVPLFMTKPFVLSSVDAYPVEFLNMKLNHIVVYGESVLDDLEFNPTHLRLQLEREFKGKVLHLQTGFLETQGKPKKIRELIKISFNAMIALFNAILYLKNIDIPRDKRRIIKALADAYPINPSVFLKCAEVKEGTDHYSSAEIDAVFRNYLQEISELSGFIDHEEI
ncbi:MAG: nucleotidyltransferase domain-containing protein [Deltaproteobacteria bacterium]|nr:nucleotidyltransferase domain-containing protein [Deltaproteobacteria bacterium]